jgi:PAS domain S-box-containing protein
MDEKPTSQSAPDQLEACRKELAQTRASLQRLQSIVDSSPAVVFLWRMEDNWPVEFVSQSVEQFGYTPEELMSGQVSWPDMTCSEDIPRLEDEVTAHLASGDTQFDQEYRLITRSGEIRWIEDRNTVIRDTDGQITHIQGMIVDITNRKQMETALRDSEASLNAAQELAHVGNWLWNLQTGAFSMSDEMLRIHGLPAESPIENIRTVVESLIHPDDRPLLRKIMEDVLSGGEGQPTSFRIIRPDGEIRWASATRHTVRQRDEEGRATVLMGTVQDITDQRAAQLALQQSEEKYRAVVESSPAVVCVWGVADDWPLQFISDGIRQFGYTPEEFISGKTSYWDLIHPEDKPQLRINPGFKPGANKYTQEYRISTKSGETRWIEDRNIAVLNTEGQITHVRSVLLDITDRKQMETALRDSEASLKAAQRLAGVGSWQWDLRTGRTILSDQLLRIYGLPEGTPPEEVNKVVDSIMHPDDRDDMRRLITDVLAGEEGRSISFRIIRPDGEIRWLDATRYTVRQRDENGNPVVIMGAVRDITEARTARIALQDSEEQYRAVVESAGEAICTIDADGVFLFMNTVCAQRFGGRPDELIGKSMWDVFPKQFADTEAARERNAILSGKSDLIETAVPLGDEIRWYEISMEPIRDHDGQVRSALVIARDITEQKRSSEGLKQSEAHLQAILTSLHQAAIFVYNTDGEILSAWTSPDMGERYGVDTTVLPGQNLRDFYPPQVAEKRIRELKEVYASGRPSRNEWSFVFPNGEFWVETTISPLRDAKGSITSLVAFARDITERKQATERLRKSEEQYRMLFEGSNEGILGADVETHEYVFANPAICDMLKYSAEEIVKMTIDKFHRPEDLAHVISCFEAQSRGEYRVAPNIPFLRKDGQVVYADVSSALINFEGKDCAVGFVHDLTEARRTAEQLRQSEEMHRTLFEGAVEGVLAADVETLKFVFANPAVCRLLQYNTEEILKLSVEDMHPPEDLAQVLGQFRAQATGQDRVARSVPFLRKDGQVVYADVAATIIRLDGRDCMVGFFHDLTEARRAEEALKTAHMKLVSARDEERKHLASELHDSVSQELVALGMLLESGRPDGGSSLAETCNKLIEDIRGICRGLYPPALEALGLVAAIQPLKEHCFTAGMNAAIQCDPIIERARFSPEVEIAMFRVAQEAVNNAIRHSGADNVDIDLMYSEGRLSLAVVDDGAGFDVSAAQGSGLGLSSMRDRANAVGAELTVRSEPGETRIEVSTAVDIRETDRKDEQ